MHYISLLLIWDVSWPQFVVLSGSNKTQMLSNHISSRYHHTSSTIIRHILNIARHILNYLEFGAFLKWGYQIIHLFYSDVPWNHPAGDPPWPTPQERLGGVLGADVALQMVEKEPVLLLGAPQRSNDVERSKSLALKPDHTHMATKWDLTRLKKIRYGGKPGTQPANIWL